jgi:hypothetical protein
LANQWRYHLGVHKTATTHLQKVLFSQRAELLAQGINYIPMEELRSVTDPIFWKLVLRQWHFRRAIRSAAPVTILSEENWLGYVQDACVHPIYPNLEKRLRIVSQTDAIAFLSIRNPAEFAASAFSEALRHAPNDVSLQATRDAFWNAGSPWLDVIKRIRRFFPRLRVWSYEDYRGNEEAYLSALAGVPVIVPRIADPVETARLPTETINSLEVMRAAGELLPKADELEPPPRPTRFQMFNCEEKAKLTKAYNRDLEILRSEGILIARPTFTVC